ncbi:MAG TPA: PepSY-like domain-containing protein [Puia sp.]|uniref:PepSY-like domain-containing protein n=1 Tax=Puia sp. TaxID=2045100 RepID=UPI002C51D75F|nr:PepSY-like domain-containing protein [Puia sp.]HVU93657.1 PepSY-like domain-containing protein [Puia sp.]
MKKSILGFVSVFVVMTMTAGAQGANETPQAVIAAFNTRFPHATVRKWEERKEGFIADFRLGRKKLFAYFASDGTWKGTETPIRWTKDLPAAVRDGWRNSDYSAWRVLDLKKIETPEQPLYTLHVNNGDLLDADRHDAFLEEYMLFFSEKGELVRKDKM